MTDANLILGRLLPEYFPKIFGESESEPLDYEASRVKFELLQNEINKYLIETGEREVKDCKISNNSWVHRFHFYLLERALIGESSDGFYTSRE